jgi:hypothetical protein
VERQEVIRTDVGHLERLATGMVGDRLYFHEQPLLDVGLRGVQSHLGNPRSHM